MLIGLASPSQIEVQTRELVFGDYLFVIQRRFEDQVLEEFFLPVIIERKTWSDLAASLKDKRWERQRANMRRAAASHPVFVLEGQFNATVQQRMHVEKETLERKVSGVACHCADALR